MLFAYVGKHSERLGLIVSIGSNESFVGNRTLHFVIPERLEAFIAKRKETRVRYDLFVPIET